MNCVVLGSRSDLIKGMMPMLSQDYKVSGWSRKEHAPPSIKWDLCIMAIGKVSPVGLWYDNYMPEWEKCIQSNLILPFELLQLIWPNRNPDATVIWFTGSNPNLRMAGYSAYHAAKQGVNALVEQLDFESDTKVIAFNPGFHRTKIHDATVKAQWQNERLERPQAVTIDQTYAAMKWCVEQDKSVVGGRNICVSDIVSRDYTDSLVAALKQDRELFKLRRREMGFQGLG